MSNPSSIRKASVEDAPAIAHVHVASWRAAYNGVLHQDYLQSLKEDDRTNRWKNILSTLSSESATYILEETGKIIGFASVGPGRTEGRQHEAELYAIYLRPDCYGKGYGRALLDGCITHAKNNGNNHLFGWVIEQNHRARSFYRAQGAVESPHESKQVQFGNQTLREVIFVFDLIKNRTSESSTEDIS